jgi:beta-lactamase regulating signal transducer with metallopeptidase domain
MTQMLALATLQSSLLLLAAAMTARVTTRATLRHAIWTAAMTGSLVVPLASRTLPPLVLELPSSFMTEARTPPAPVHYLSPGRAATSAVEQGARRGPAASTDPRRVMEVAITLWLVGALVVLLQLAFSLRATFRLVRRARPLTDEALRRDLALVRRHHGFDAEVRVLVSDDIASAATFGIVSQCVLLPADAHAWSRAHTRVVFAHELAHVSRRDCATQLVARAACVLYWFNPLVWFANRQMMIERERACDDLVLAGGEPATVYAQALVDAVRAARGRTMIDLPGPVLAMARASELESRVRRILNASAVHRRLGWTSRAALAVASVACVLLTAAVRIGAAQAPGPPTWITGEPDLRGDSVASPMSERLSFRHALDSSRVRALRAGPDSVMARAMSKALARVPRWEGDLVRDRAAWALSHADGTRLFDPMLAALADRDWRVRAYAAWSLGHSANPRATAPLEVLLDHPVWRVRAAAASALQQLNDPAARQAMVRATADIAWQVRVSAVGYLVEQRDPALAPVIRAALQDRHVAVRDAAAQRSATEDFR